MTNYQERVEEERQAFYAVGDREREVKAKKRKVATSFDEKVAEGNKYYPQTALPSAGKAPHSMDDGLNFQDAVQTVPSEKNEDTIQENVEEPFVSALPPPPSFEELEWCFRFVLSRATMLPHLRRAGLEEDFFTESRQHNEAGAYHQKQEFDKLGNLILHQRNNFYKYVFNAFDEEIYNRNYNFDPTDILTVVPLADFLQAPPDGNANVRMMVKTTKEEGEGESLTLQLVATEPIDELDTLTLPFSKSYSLSYTLYKYGFLPLRQREVERGEVLSRYGVMDLNESDREVAGGKTASFVAAMKKYIT
ncbi:hypothetical protein AGDE_15754 [Angomonas deanei]|uniref:Uncharacterized protein n=1 Tax=Angomonas deanei TaxID=59799 RepID=A0A7G2C568_9TRYP|nr:hypothetical protein AGDE_15754 [Angomonas deanei]CAD2213907.1 hypothetical protein, conserved [Angomonas deanei]|eukprot:EPY18536.1 hypothetical protein AGDE_15754 [Angomonas deanei]